MSIERHLKPLLPQAGSDTTVAQGAEMGRYSKALFPNPRGPKDRMVRYLGLGYQCCRLVFERVYGY